MGSLMPAFATAAPDFIGAIRTQMAALPAGAVLLNSYIVETGPNLADFDITQANAAYVYDNALAALALHAAGDVAAATRIAEALAIAQNHDRFYNDGRLRNAYQAGAMTKPAKLPGWWDDKAKRWNEDPYQVGSATGPLAWAMLLWAKLSMNEPANAAGHFLDDNLRAPFGYYGGFYGFEPAPLKLIWQSTEQNTDIFVACRKLGRADDAGHAARFVRARLDASTQRFLAGTTPLGAPNPLLAADAGIWPYLAGLGDKTTALNAINALRRGAGIGFSESSTSIWLEGTAFATLALGHDSLARDFTTTIAANLSPEGYVYASVAPMLKTGLTIGPSLQANQPEQPFNYYRRPSLSATSWAALAALGANPLA